MIDVFLIIIIHFAHTTLPAGRLFPSLSLLRPQSFDSVTFFLLLPRLLVSPAVSLYTALFFFSNIITSHSALAIFWVVLSLSGLGSGLPYRILRTAPFIPR